jgi:hypothetical protein
VIPYDFHPEAKAEFIEATVFYESRRAGLGASFAAEVERMITLIRSHPDVGTPGGLRRRRMSVLGFPYSVVTDTIRNRYWSWLLLTRVGRPDIGVAGSSPLT